MIHGIYIKTRPKAKWHLVSKAASIEMANKDVIDIVCQYKMDGTDIMVAIQSFDSDFYIPEYLSAIKEQKQFYN